VPSNESIPAALKLLQYSNENGEGYGPSSAYKSGGTVMVVPNNEAQRMSGHNFNLKARRNITEQSPYKGI
jgi:hypothetical protein